MKSRVFMSAAALAALLSVAAIAEAGTRWAYQVSISDVSRYAVGTTTDARGSADVNQSIGCNHNTTFASCYATNSAGLSRSCTTSNAALIDVIRSIGSESYIYFTWNTDGTCNYVLVENSSRWKPASASGL
ncbi:MAG: hypothetical protein ACOY82_17750 [Pseudomonadota bacterium]